jgi:DNA-binding NarL/FixJ family response regulator
MGLNNSPLSFPSSASPTRVIIADPYPVIVHGVRKMVEDDPRFQVVADASTMQAFRKKITAKRPDVALVDWSMASRDIAGTTELLQSAPHGPSIIFLSFLSVSENSPHKREMLRLGARGFLSKWSSAHKLQKAVHAASNGRPRREGPTADTGPPSTNSDPERIKHLTHRERQLLPLVCCGLRNKEIAQELGISESTVWHHMTAIFTKLKVEDRVALVAFVYRHHLIQHDGLAVDPMRPIHPVVTPHLAARSMLQWQAPDRCSPHAVLSFRGGVERDSSAR